MEVRRKQTLFWMYLKQIVILAALIFAEAALFFVCFGIGMNTGVILPANATENYLREKETEISQSEEFDESLLPHTCRYGIFDEQGNYKEGTLTERMRATAQALAENPKESKSEYMVIKRPAGYCVIHYPISAQFANPTLYRIFPRLEWMFLCLFAVVMILLVIGSAVGFRKKLKRELAPLLEEIEQVKQKELSEGKSSSKIREFDEVLAALNDMKKELSRSLSTEWETEQRRKENISALAHDIKTPLTIIKGNAELMKEETDLAELYEQAELVNQNVDEIERYMKLLMEENKGTSVAGRECEIVLAEWMEEIERQILALGKAEKVPVIVKKQETDQKVIADSELLQRAIMNLVTNAMEHTDRRKGIWIAFSCQKEMFQVEIEDFGNGFSREALSRGKEQFYTERKERSASHYGLGMYVADTVAKKYGGSIECFNKSEKAGAVVRFRVPFCC